MEAWNTESEFTFGSHVYKMRGWQRHHRPIERYFVTFGNSSASVFYASELMRVILKYESFHNVDHANELFVL